MTLTPKGAEYAKLRKLGWSIERIAKKHGIEPRAVKATIGKESRGKPGRPRAKKASV